MCTAFFRLTHIGATIVASNLKLAVQRAIYADKNARVQLNLHSLFGGLAGLSLDQTEHQGVTALSEQEAHLNDEFSQIDRACSYPLSLLSADERRGGLGNAGYERRKVLRREAMLAAPCRCTALLCIYQQFCNCCFGLLRRDL